MKRTYTRYLLIKNSSLTDSGALDPIVSKISNGISERGGDIIYCLLNPVAQNLILLNILYDDKDNEEMIRPFLDEISEIKKFA